MPYLCRLEKNKHMYTVLVIVGLVVFALLIVYLSFATKLKKREKLCKEWKVGDKLIVDSLELELQLQKRGLEYAILSGCNLDNVIIQIGDDVYCRDWDVVKHNKSHTWRQNYEKCKSSMGVEPSFNPIIKDGGSSNPSGMIDGKPIELLSEVECQIYLKQALEEENFELAEKIRQQMLKFR
jgi:hypothetical protein